MSFTLLGKIIAGGVLFGFSLEADVSNVILQKIFGVMKSAPRFVRGHLEGTPLSHWREMGALFPAQEFGCAGAEAAVLCSLSQWNQVCSCASSTPGPVCGASMQEFCHVTPAPESVLCSEL